MSTKALLVIQMGEPPEDVASQVGPQGKWFADTLPEGANALRVIRPDLGEPLPPFEQLSAAIISGSWSMVTDRLDWSEYTAGWLREAFHADVPLLGVCYGHQLLSHALGGTVGDNPNGAEMGLQTVTLHPGAENVSWLRQHPEQFQAYLSHRQSVLVPPEGAQVLASSAVEGCQIIRYGDNALSVQFHPEFNADIMRACLRRNEVRLRQLGFDYEQMMQLSDEPRWARKILLDFIQQYATR
ncbi:MULTISPECIES: glutamine amidotransferase [unclassified Brenneria]|uniref:glutamine amidotransferase n=1 Tax=unclassified Brenneria TaxID=2634434 RepID=UPI0029C3284B|nr:MULTISPECIES: glutamine amidotransferase [unclassified Brenneria]MDX5629181.1 glutamine amidotransferase [Brenneria sp. L3-3Z]MDX5696320.1 glutamine amidotransferase [Brenneria sp. L4-2C]MEE3662810.1 glutamine amidotransferase [Brenneria sp. g21c3]